MLLLVLIISHLCCMLNKSAAELRCAFLSVGLIRLAVMWKVFLLCLSATRAELYFKWNHGCCFLHSQRANHDTGNTTHLPNIHPSLLVKSVISWNSTRGSRRNFRCLFLPQCHPSKRHMDTRGCSFIFVGTNWIRAALLHCTFVSFPSFPK